MSREESDDALKSLLDDVGRLARSDDSEAAAFPAEELPALSLQMRERLVKRILATRAGGGEAPIASMADARPRLRRAASRPAMIAAVAGSIAAAAAFLLWLRPGGEGPPLPGYAISAEGGEKDVRGGPEPAGNDPALAALQRVRRRSELVVNARPDASVTGPIAARAFVVWGNAVTEAVTVSRVASSGAVQLVVKGADVVGERRGPGLLRVVVGRPDAIGGLDPERASRDNSGPGWRALTVPLVFEAD